MLSCLPGKLLRFSCTAKQLHRGVSSRNSGRPLGHAALDHTRPTAHAYTQGHTVVVWRYGGMAVPRFALAAISRLSALCWLSCGRVSLSAPSSTPARSFACACVSMADPVVIAATADTVRHSESIVQGAHGGTTHYDGVQTDGMYVTPQQ
jgi:hypothetical protein